MPPTRHHHIAGSRRPRVRRPLIYLREAVNRRQQPLAPYTHTQDGNSDLYIPTENEANGIIATISTLIGTAIGGVVGFVIDPENRWIVQLAVTVTSSFVLFGLGKGVDIYLKVKFGKHNDR
jgi:hypothetical protein